MKYYLSIDADYWNGLFPYHGWAICQKEYLKLECSIRNTLLKLKQLHVPVKVKKDHHELLEHMNGFKFDALVNIDYHADLCDGIPETGSLDNFNCGTWGNYISMEIKERGTFIWVYSADDSVFGRCNSDGSKGYCNDNPRKNPFLTKDSANICGWKKTKQVKRRLPKNLWDNIVAAGICYSPDYTDPNILPTFKKIVKEVKLCA